MMNQSVKWYNSLSFLGVVTLWLVLGLDAAICWAKPHEKTLIFAGAKLPLYSQRQIVYY